MYLQQTFGPLSLLLFAALFSSSEGFIAPVSRLPSTIAGGEKQDSWILRSETFGTQEQVDVEQVNSCLDVCFLWLHVFLAWVVSIQDVNTDLNATRQYTSLLTSGKWSVQNPDCGMKPT